MKVTVRLGLLALAMTSGTAHAGQLLFDISDMANPVVAVNTVLPSLVGGTGNCWAVESDSSECRDVNFTGPAETTSIRVLDSFTGATTTFAAVPGFRYLMSNSYSSTAVPELTFGYLGLYWQGPVWGIGESFAIFTPETSARFPCNGQCVGQLTGGMQTLATISYLDAGGSVIGTDTLDVITTVTATPEPGTIASSLGGFLLLAGWLTKSRSRR